LKVVDDVKDDESLALRSTGPLFKEDLLPMEPSLGIKSSGSLVSDSDLLLALSRRDALKDKTLLINEEFRTLRLLTDPFMEAKS
jgi:hypothetical protein